MLNPSIGQGSLLSLHEPDTWTHKWAESGWQVVTYPNSHVAQLQEGTCALQRGSQTDREH